MDLNQPQLPENSFENFIDNPKELVGRWVVIIDDIFNKAFNGEVVNIREVRITAVHLTTVNHIVLFGAEKIDARVSHVHIAIECILLPKDVEVTPEFKLWMKRCYGNNDENR